MKKALLILGLIAMVATLSAQTVTLYWEDFEDGFDWDATDMYWYDDTDVYWHADTFNSYDGNSYWCGTLDVGGTGYNGYNDGWLQYMDTPSLTIPTGGSPLLTFKHRLNTEPSGAGEYPFGYDGWDCASMWISADAGDTWGPLTPSTPTYDCTSAWCFGFCGVGPGIPGWTGEHGATAFEPVTIDLASYAGETVMIRFVFSSDMMFCTGPTHSDPPNFDAAMFGWIVDDVTVADGDDTLLFATGDGSSMSFSQGRELTTWERTDADAYGGTYSVMTKAYSEAYNLMTSPMISIPDTFAGTLTFAVKCEFVDSDPDTDSYLDDFFNVYVVDSTEDTTYRLFYDYYREDIIDESWNMIDESILFNGSTSLRSFAGHDVRIQVMSRSDGQPDTSQHLYIDDVKIEGRYALLHDLAPKMIASGPLNLGENARFTVRVGNDGMSSETLIQVFGRIEYPDGSDTTVVFFPRPTVDGGETGTASTYLMTNQEGTYIVQAWTNLSTDMDGSNDTLEVTFEIPGDDIRELGWDDGVNDVVINSESGTRVDGFLGGSFAPGDAIGTFLYDNSGLSNLVLTHIKFYTRYSGPAQIQVMNSSGTYDDLPSGAIVLYDEEHTISADTIDGEWVTIDLSSDPVDLPDSSFFVFIGTAVDSQMPVVGTDGTSPLERWGFAIIGTDTMTLRDAASPYNSIDMMIRAIIMDELDVDEKGSDLPREVALHDNYPNPFNPTTSIGFDLPEACKTQLSVYNVLGEKIATLVDDNMNAGSYRIIWDGRDDKGADVPSGLYLYKLITPEKELNNRMILLK